MPTVTFPNAFERLLCHPLGKLATMHGRHVQQIPAAMQQRQQQLAIVDSRQQRIAVVT